MKKVRLGKTGLMVSPIGYGTFKIGRNQQIKYSDKYDLPSEQESTRLLNQILDMGINYFDTAPSYGISEERTGQALAHRRHEFVLSTKTGETFDEKGSRYDYSKKATQLSIEQSLKNLKTDLIDIVFIHSNGRDLEIQQETDVISTLQHLKTKGLIKHIGFSGKTIQGTMHALNWADVIMVEYHMEDLSHEDAIKQASDKGIGVVIKKGLASGKLPPDQAIRFLFRNPHLQCVVIGGLNLNHIQQNMNAAIQDK